VDDDARRTAEDAAGVGVRHRDGHLRLLHEFVVADERPDQHLLRALVDDDVEALDELGRCSLHAVRVQPPARAAMRPGRQSAMPQWDRDGDVSRTKYRCWARRREGAEVVVGPDGELDVGVLAGHQATPCQGQHSSGARTRMRLSVVREGAREVLSGIAVTSLPVWSELAVALA
jgi:hypothetical protein